MCEQARGTRFGLEAREEFVTREAGAFCGQSNGFYGNAAADDRIGGAINHTHGAAAEFAYDFVPPGFGHRGHEDVFSATELFCLYQYTRHEDGL
jgi:hypothetical protein